MVKIVILSPDVCGEELYARIVYKLGSGGGGLGVAGAGGSSLLAPDGFTPGIDTH